MGTLTRTWMGQEMGMVVSAVLVNIIVSKNNVMISNSSGPSKGR